MISEKYRKGLRYIGWIVISFFLVVYLTYLIKPSILEDLGIDMKSFAKNTFIFFIVKGCITTSIIIYGAWKVRKKIKK